MHWLCDCDTSGVDVALHRSGSALLKASVASGAENELVDLSLGKRGRDGG